MERNEAEAVAASEIEVGDDVFFPNSRKPQTVEGILAESNLIHLSIPETTWKIAPDFQVRRVVKPQTEEEQ